jgi:hypothetical protein
LISLKVHHKTTYRFNKPVALGPPRLMLRPRESRDLRLISSHVTVTPESVLTLAHDVFGNAVATATFQTARQSPDPSRQQARCLAQEAAGTNTTSTTASSRGWPLDAYGLIKTMIDRWREVFDETFPRNEKHSAIRRAGVGPVDMQQSIIDPGMGVFTRYGKALENDDGPMSVRTALSLINRAFARPIVEFFCRKFFT